MGLLLGTRRSLLGGVAASTYIDKVMSYSPIAYWPLWEAVGATAVCQVNSPAQDGTYVGVTLGQPGIGDGNTAPFFDGTNDYVDIYSVPFNAAFKGLEGTFAVWARVFNVGVWTDGANRFLGLIRTDANNEIQCYKSVAANTLTWYFRAGTVLDNIVQGGYTDVDWFLYGLTWSRSAGATGEVRAYFNGAQVGTTQTGLGNWVGALNPVQCLIGSYLGPPALAWHGWLAHKFVLDYAASGPQMLDLATV